MISLSAPLPESLGMVMSANGLVIAKVEVVIYVFLIVKTIRQPMQVFTDELRQRDHLGGLARWSC